MRALRAPLVWLPPSALLASIAAVLPAFPLREVLLVAFLGVGPGWAFLSVAGLLGDAIHRIHHNESVSALFKGESGRALSE